ncbi:MAG: hypothetical protein H7X86_08185 [Gorillibacterium sp.]|nr:hypothetical protein [Gorillibacterium sp.]
MHERQWEYNAGIWQYQAEWVRDSSMMAMAMLYCGLHEDAEKLLCHIIRDMTDEEGRTLVGGTYVEIENEQFDQAGQLLNTLYEFYLWTGNDRFIREDWCRIEALANRLNHLHCRDEGTKLFHNKREFWERNEWHGVERGYELAYQVWPVLGLRAANQMAVIQGSEQALALGRIWHASTDTQWDAVLNHPLYAFIRDGKWVKRIKMDGEVQEIIKPVKDYKEKDDIPLGNEPISYLNPDASVVFPIIYGLVSPDERTVLATLEDLEQLWNMRWNHGGYDRYHTSSEPDTPGPWIFASLFLARANHAAGRLEHSRKVLEWLNRIQGGTSGAWHEYIPVNEANTYRNGILIWDWAEIILFLVRDVLGVRPGEKGLQAEPKLFPGMGRVSLKIPYQGKDIQINWTN